MKLAPWLSDTWRGLVAALADGRLHHGLLIVAPDGFGKRELVAALAATVLCMQRAPDGHACGRCRGCELMAAGSHPDLVHVSLGLRDDGKPRQDIVIDQIRALAQRLSMSSQFGGYQIALIDPADRMNPNAANALLKTLEEPSTATLMVLVADDVSRLPATIRSRCQRVEFRSPTRAEALDWLGGHGIDAARGNEALDASLGNPGHALAWLGDGTLALRNECAQDLAALTRGSTSAAALAERWTADRPEARLWFAAVLARDESRRLAKGEKSAFGLTARTEIPKLAAWYARVNRTLGLLATPLRAELIVLDLLLAWPFHAIISRRA